MIRAIFDWVAISISTILIGIPALVVSAFAPRVVLGWFVRPWCRVILKACGVKVELEGLDNLPSSPCVIMFNHQSYFDIFAFAATLPIDWRAVMKRELAWVPFFGWVAKATGHYFVRRDGSIRSLREMDKLARDVGRGQTVLIAPEGTRSLDGRLGQFKPGGFVVAIKAGVPVVPMVIKGGKEVMPSGSLRIRAGKMSIKILPPIDVKMLPSGKEGREALSKMVREAMLSELYRESPRKGWGAS
jgi:1-acyl-sn-glycerol-3-phosphate acyltransferase